MVAAAGLVMRRTRDRPPAASALVLVAAVLKLFPIAAVGMLARLPWQQPSPAFRWSLGIFAVYATVTLRDIRTIERVLPQGDEYAFGLRHLWRLAGASRWARTDVDAVLVAVAIVAAIALRRRLRSQLNTGQSRELDLFWAGAGIYVATFALGRTSDYRLVFLLRRSPNSPVGRRLARRSQSSPSSAFSSLSGYRVLGATSRFSTT